MFIIVFYSLSFLTIVSLFTAGFLINKKRERDQAEVKYWSYRHAYMRTINNVLKENKYVSDSNN